MLRRVLVGIGLLVVFVLALAIFSRLDHAFGAKAVVTLVAALFGAAAWAATPESRAAAQDVEAALRDIGLGKEAAAITMGMDPAHFSRQLNGVEQLSLSRLAQLGPEFDRAFARRRLERVGGYTVIADGVLTQMLELLRSLVTRKEAA